MTDCSRYARLVTLTILACVVVYLVGNGSVPLWDRDEPRYATASRHMAEHGDWVVPQFLGQPRTAKPILIYWLQAGAMKLFGPTAFAARFPSVVSMTLTLSLLAIALPSIVGRRRAAWTVFVLGSSILAIVTAKMSLTDATLLLFVTASQLCIYRRRANALPSVAAPIGIVGWVARVLLVMLIVAAALAPWLWLIEQRLPGYLLNTLHREIFLRGTQAAEGHTGPPGFYLLTVWGTFFPWCLLLPAALVLGWRHRANPPLRFALAAVVGPWLFLEIYVTKLPHYLISTFPFLSLLVADLVVRTRRRMVDETSNRGFRIGVAVWRGAVLLLALAAFAVLFIETQPPVVLVGLLILAAIAFEYGRTVHRAMLARRMTIAAVVMGIGTWLVVLVAHSLILPYLGFLQISPRIAALLREDGATDQPDVRMIDYKEPSLGFYQGGSIREEIDDRFLVSAPPGDWPRWLVITDEKFRLAPDAVQDRWTLLGAADGIAYADGMRKVRVLALRRRD